ncbi:hypothetical protein ACFFJX_02115 [Pseudarcicella hirudinis]
MEYTPAPPFDSGSPERAEHHLVEKVKILTKTSFDTRLKIIKEIMENA